MASSLEDVGAQPGGVATRSLLAVTLNDDGSRIIDNVVSDAYSASITPDGAVGRWHKITVTDNSALTINAPANPPSSSKSTEVAIEVKNTAGGAMGVITWNAAFVFTGQTWANPANNKSRWARFHWNGAAWVCVGAATADY